MARRMNRRGAVLVAAAGMLAASVGGVAGVASASPDGRSPTRFTAWEAPATFSAPPDVGQIEEPLSANPSDLAAHGYVEQEYFASGTAYAFKSTSTPSNGRWTFKVGGSAPYTTRILVRRPSNPANFDGNVVVEWMNVSAGETAPDWDYLDPALMDSGAAYVGVSAQALGVNGGKAILGSGSSPGLRGLEPARYGSLHHPGDQYSLDIFAQIGRALRAPAPSVLGGLRPSHVLAIGESQSAFYLTTYADTLQSIDHSYQGLFIHSRGGGAVPLGNQNVTAAITGRKVRIRPDLHVPVFMFETQTDLIQLGYAGAQQRNTKHIRTWEVAGTSHADAYELGVGAGFLGCTTPVNDGPQHQVVQAAFVAFLNWVDHGTRPPSPKRFALARKRPARLALDAHGNVVGGVRTPAVDVPISTLSGAPPKGSSELCGLFGSTTPFSPQTLVALYGSKAGYLAAYTADLNRAIAGRYLLPADRAGLLEQAEQVQFPS
ncbi:MAG: alpha/beta hydrolase domain-containing protein [Acidimicrobiales bacterium]